MNTENQEGLEQKGTEQVGSADQTVSNQQTSNLSEQTDTGGPVTREEFEQYVKEMRGLQGKMDKDARKIEERLESTFRRKLAELDIPLTPEHERKIEIMELRDQISRLEGNNEGVTANDNTQPPVEIAEVFDTLGIQEPTPEQMKVAMRHANNPLKLALELQRIQLSKPNASLGSAITPEKKVQTSTANIDELVNEFNSLRGMAQDHVLSNGQTVRQRRNELAGEIEEAEKN